MIMMREIIMSRFLCTSVPLKVGRQNEVGKVGRCGTKSKRPNPVCAPENKETAACQILNLDFSLLLLLFILSRQYFLAKKGS